MSVTDTEKQRLIAAILQRREESTEVPRIDNASLVAGQPMYYYCKLCWKLAAILEETHECPVPQRCAPCEAACETLGLSGAELERALKRAHR